MIFIKIAGLKIQAKVTDIYSDPEWNLRDSERITVSLSYNEVKELFANNTPWSIIVEEESYMSPKGSMITPDPVEIDKGEYSISGEITDHRNGTISIKMGKPTTEELLKSYKQ